VSSLAGVAAPVAALMSEQKFRALTSNAGWFAVLVLGMLVTLISKGNSVRLAFVYGRPNPKLRPQL
jgi:hypothetical protein